MLCSKFESHVKLRAQAYDPAVHGIPAEIYGALGMAGEAGELVGKVKKLWRDDGGRKTKERSTDILSELGDVLWYLTYTANAMGFSLADVMNFNVQKLNDRAARGVQKGDGDHR